METINIFNELERKLRDYISENGLRDTPERHRILKAICEEEDEFTATDVFIGIIIQDDQYINQKTIYNTLDIFEKAELIKRIPSLNGSSLFTITVNNH